MHLTQFRLKSDRIISIRVCGRFRGLFKESFNGLSIGKEERKREQPRFTGPVNSYNFLSMLPCLSALGRKDASCEAVFNFRS